MKKIILSLLVVVALTACSNHGKKVKVEGTKAEVFYKGDGVTEDDAKKTGEFLKSTSIFSSGKDASVQLTKDGEEYTIRFVYDKDVYDTLKGVDDVFKLIAAKASKEVFAGKKVNIALANKSFKDFKIIPYDEAVAKALETPAQDETTSFKKDFDHDSIDGIDFYWRDITDDESKTIADYILKDGSFSGGSSELYMTKEDNRYMIRFPVKESSRTDPSFLARIEVITKQIKDDLFANVPFSFAITDENMNTTKAWDY
ncbi:MAG: hypothetical protein LH619_06435 [Chitinophagaceae bacterium]|nr:hypothetical protein [Chitinophagaceae bacterium]